MSRHVNRTSELLFQSVSRILIILNSKIKEILSRLKTELFNLITYFTHLNVKCFLCKILQPEHRTTALFISAILLLSVISSFSIQTKGSILPVDKDVVHAFKMLKSTSSGRKLIEKVRNITKGSLIFLTIGNTEKDNLMDECGEKVRGLTRVDFRMSGHTCSVGRVTVITNRDMVGSDVYEIVKSIAFELENVYQVFNLSCACPWIDSPQAPQTQARVIEELGITN